MNPIDEAMDNGGMRYISKSAASTDGGFTFPITEARLSKEVIDGCNLRPGLNRFAEALVDQMQKKEGRPDVVGIVIHNIGFTMILGRTKEENLAEKFLGSGATK